MPRKKTSQRDNTAESSQKEGTPSKIDELFLASPSSIVNPAYESDVDGLLADALLKRVHEANTENDRLKRRVAALEQSKREAVTPRRSGRKTKSRVNEPDVTENDASPTRSSDDEFDGVAREVSSKYRTRKEIKVECYAGDGSIESYLAQFKLAARRNGWSEDEWADELTIRLRGEARELILPNDGAKVPRFEKLCKMLRERFGAMDIPALHVAQLRGRKRKEKESVPELVQWFTSVGAKAYPEETQRTRDRFLLEFFIGALTNERQRHYVRDDEPLTIAEAARSAIRWEGIHKAEEQWSKDTPTERRYTRAVVAQDTQAKSQTQTGGEALVNKVPVVAALTTDSGETLIKQLSENFAKTLAAGMDQLTTKMKEVLYESTPGYNPRTTLVSRYQKPVYNPRDNNGGKNRQTGTTNSSQCFNCGRSGHFARDCRSLLKCYSCGGLGHLAKACPYGRDDVNDNSHTQGNGQGRGMSGATVVPNQ